MQYAYIALLVLLVAPFASAFLNNARTSRSTTARLALDDATLQKLEDIRSKYTVLAETDEERTGLADVVEKYATYREIKGMMKKLRTMWVTEASERRRAKQLKSFVDLYRGRLEIEEVIKEKLGLSAIKQVPAIRELDEIAKWDSEIAALEKKLSDVEIVLPSGMTTREERFGN